MLLFGNFHKILAGQILYNTDVRNKPYVPLFTYLNHTYVEFCSAERREGTGKNDIFGL